ncbi:MAG: hypothetical protein Q8M15_17000 [Bacteroidota bacterium]|nr:hypothetical protein [Bacteroidota bacterium]
MKTKKHFYLSMFLILLAVFTVTAQPKQDILSNESVTVLFQKGLGTGIIINKIKTTKNTFDVSTDALVKLKNDGIPDEIVSAMIESTEKNKVEIVDLNDPKVMHNSGIYYYNPADIERQLSRIDPTVVSSGKSGGFGQALASHYTYGLANAKTTSILSGANSRKQIQSKQIVFYFYFDHSNNSLNQAANWWFASATSPNEFALVKMKEKKDCREFVIGKSNSYGSSIGIDEKQKVSFGYEEIAENIYKIIITGSLSAGEYCFIYTGATPSMYSNDKVFDFGIY